MMLRQLASGLQRLSLQATITAAVRSPASTAVPNANIPRTTTNSTSLVLRCWLHTSPACQRTLDTHTRIRNMKTQEPSSRSGRWVLNVNPYEKHEYQVEPVPYPRTGGRGPNGRIWNHKRGGGLKKVYRMIDWTRSKPDQNEDVLEKVDHILLDACRSAHIALVASGERKRWIIATQNMKAGDIIRSSKKLSRTVVRANEGDSYPVGSLAIGTLVNCLEQFPDEGSYFARSAGVSAQIIRRQEKETVLRLPSKREVSVANSCLATVGRVSNIDHNKRVLGKAGAKRWLGIRPSSGRWHRKTGRFGRKIKPPKKTKVYDKKAAPSRPVYKMSF